MIVNKFFFAEQPLVSIGVVTFNGAKYLGEQLQSLVDQSYPNLEIVISDDASTDDTVTVAEGFLSDDRVTLVKSPVNRGLRRNLNALLPALRGELIAICDQDDVWERDKVSLLVQNIGASSGIYSDSVLIGTRGELIGGTLLQSLNIRTPKIGRNFVGLSYKNVVSGHAALYRREVFQGVLPFLERPIYDQQLAMYASAIGGIAYYPFPLVRHRQHESNSHNVSLVDKAKTPKSRRPTRAERARQVGFNLGFSAGAYLSSGSLTWLGRYIARTAQRAGRDLQDKKSGRFFLKWRLLVLSPLLLRYSQKKNPISTVLRLAS